MLSGGSAEEEPGNP